MKAALLALLLAAFAQAHAQSGVLVSPLPEEVNSLQALEAARQVLVARGWMLVPVDRASIDARKENSGMRLFVSGRTLRFTDQSVRSRGTKQREHREAGPQLTAVPQAEIDALRADLAAAFAGNLPAGARPAAPPSHVLVSNVPPADPARVMDKVRLALVSRGWKVLPNEDAIVVAQNRSGETEARIRIFLADGALRYVDQSTQRGAGKAQVPERWIVYLRADLAKSLRALPAKASSADDPVERLHKLKALLDGGMITPAEYEAKRAEILKGL
jgi:hypothetical protein